MSTTTVHTSRPQRWDHPLDESMDATQVAWLMRLSPFSQMDASRFSEQAPLADILRNDCRLLQLEPGDMVFREGQYGGSAYLVLDGQVRVLLTRLLTDEELQRRRQFRQKRSGGLGWLGFSRLAVAGRQDRRAQKRTRSQPRNSSTGGRQEQPVRLALRQTRGTSRIYLQDIPGVLSSHQTAAVGPGELFGEMAAVTRTPREFTAIAENKCLVLEIRWQGLKLLRQDPAFRQLLDERYRAEVLKSHLRESPLFRFVPDKNLDQIVAATRLEQFGELEWYAKYRRQATQVASQRIAAEPLVAEEGQYAGALWIVRSGFARLSRRQGAGHRTLSYLGKGQMFGLAELTHNACYAAHCPPLPYQESLRAIGYVDLLCIPRQVVVDHVLPYIRKESRLPPIESPRYEYGQPVLDAPLASNHFAIETGLLEFLVEQRLMNGRQAMMIDMTRCTRCDDCVRACATTHGGTPVFVRQGPQYGRWMFAQACMHCEDPVCMIGCPTGAIHRDMQTGLAKISAASCIGCKSCAESCPYGNIRMVVSKDHRGRARVDQATGQPIVQASKCDLCADGPGQATCQTACPHDALVRINLSDIQQLSQHLQRRAA
ncbi:MAG: cyclic nucleotide-binding domain-containing protein [Pirellulaceae bacterium]|nr:cyclic nucleotide-binding domain-containing protein [Pirellulaceae bacterium]